MDEKQIQLMLKYPKLPPHSIPTRVLMDGWIGFGPLDLVLGLGLNLKFRPIWYLVLAWIKCSKLGSSAWLEGRRKQWGRTRMEPWRGSWWLVSKSWRVFFHCQLRLWNGIVRKNCVCLHFYYFLEFSFLRAAQSREDLCGAYSSSGPFDWSKIWMVQTIIKWVKFSGL